MLFYSDAVTATQMVQNNKQIKFKLKILPHSPEPSACAQSLCFQSDV